MRKIASHRILDLKTGAILAMHVVEITHDGSVARTYPLCGENQNIEWLPGLLIQSPEAPALEVGEHFAEFIQRMQKKTIGNESDSKLYLVSPFNVSQMEFCPSTRIMPLKG
jgi:hypothetical protein